MLVESKMTDEIRNFLETDLIANLNIFGIIENSKHIKIYTDDTRYPTGVLVKDEYYNYIYTMNDMFIEKVLKQFMSQKGEYGFSGIKTEIAQKIKDKYNIEWESPCILYYYGNKVVDKLKIKSEVSNIKIEDAEIIDTYYTYKSEESIISIKESINKRYTSAIYHNKELVSWVLVHEDNSLGPMYTKKEYRNKGYAIDVTLDTVDKLLKNNKIPFLHVVKDNTPGHALANQCGFKYYETCEWFGIII